MAHRSLAVVLALSIFALAPARASACGGLFCDALFAAPVVQSGEQIIYGVEEDGSLVMSIRIAYQGTAPDFAWILPVPVEPTLELGTNAVFDALLAATAPTFVRDFRVDGTCAVSPVCEYPAFDGGGVSDAAARDAGSGTTVSFEGTLGAYETVVLSATTGSELQAWLTDHDYLITADSIPLLDSYVALGHRFVALRLRTDASVAEIQPITLHMPGVAPCLPIRLTSIATQPDLPITAFFLASARAVPMNYSVVTPDFRDPGLWSFDPAPYTSYYSWVTRAVDAIGGQAFITDYAGASPSVAVTLPSVLDLADATDPRDVLAALQSFGYLADPQILPLLARFIVPPAGAVPSSYFACVLRGFGGCEPPVSFDPAGLATAIDVAITQPRAAADAMVARHPYTSRLFTTMSAAEMTLDPEFRLDPALGDVSNVHRATVVSECDAEHYAGETAVHLELPSGETIGRRSAGPHRTPEEYCAGGWVRGHHDGGASSFDAGPLFTPTGAGGCAVVAGSVGGTAWPWMLLAACVGVVARRRRST